MRIRILLLTLLSLGLGLAACSESRDSITGPDPGAASPTLLSVGGAGMVTDPTGDFRDDPRTDPDPDLTSATVSCDGSLYQFEVHVDPVTFDPDSTSFSVVIDSDRDPSTGFPGVTSEGTDSEVMSTDYVLFLNVYTAEATLLRFVSSPYNYEVVDRYALTTLTDGFSAAVPREDIAGDGRWNYKVLSQSRAGEGTTYGIIDVMPDYGLAPGIPVGCPIDLTLDLRPSGASPPINCRNPNKLITLVLPGSADFDVSEVDHTTVRFAGAGEWHVDRGTGEARRHEAGTGDDVYPDLVFHFRLSDTGLDCASTEAEFTGNLYDGTPFSALVPVTMNDPSREEVASAPTR